MEWGICGLKSKEKPTIITAKKVYIFFICLFFIISFVCITFSVPRIAMCILYGIMMCFFAIVLRNKILQFVQQVEEILELIIDDEMLDEHYIVYRDDLFSKLLHKLEKMCVLQKQKQDRIVAERNVIEEAVSDIAHQVKTPMTNIKMYQDILVHNLENNGEYNDIACIIQSQVNKLDFLIQSMLKISELESGIINLNIDKCLLNTCFMQALENAVPYAKRKNIRINVHDKMDIEIFCDIKWTAEAIFNIMDNSIKYTATGGTIDIFYKKVGFYVCLCIRDNGIGIEKENLNNIFKRFYREQNDSKIEGVGIGLSLSREIMLRQGGYITVESEKNKGSEFSIFFPQRELVIGEDYEM